MLNPYTNIPKPLHCEIQRQLFEKLAAGDTGAREQLILYNMRLAFHVAHKFAECGLDDDDIFSVATIGLIKAVDYYDLSKETAFATFAITCIRNQILMEIRKRNNQKYLLLINDDQDEDEEEDLISNAADDELLPEELLEIKEDKEEAQALISQVTTHLDEMKEFKRKIFSLYYGLNENKKCYSQADIANMVGISQSAVSRNIMRTIGMLKKKNG